MPKNTFPGTLTEANLAQLADENTSVLDPGVLAYVQDLDAYYRFSPTDTTPADGINVIQPNNVSLAGRWSLLITEDDIFASQPVWFIDPVNGNDENTGNSALTPIKTHDELRRRIGNSIIYIPVTVTLMGNFDKTNAVLIDFTLGFKDGAWGQLNYVGTKAPTVVAGTITAPTTQVDYTTNTSWSITGGFDWTTSDAIAVAGGNVDLDGAGRRIRFDDTSSIPGAVCWAVKDLGANTARVSPPSITSQAAPFYGFALPIVGDTFIVEKLFKVENFAVDLKSESLVGLASLAPTPLTVSDLALGNLTDNVFPGFPLFTGSTMTVRGTVQGAFAAAFLSNQFLNCQVGPIIAFDTSLGLTSCHACGPVFEWSLKAGSSPITLIACAQTTRILVEGGFFAYSGDTTYQENAFFAGSNAVEARHGGTIVFGGGSGQVGSGAVGFFDSTADGAIYLNTGSYVSAVHEAFSGDGGVVYGAMDAAGGSALVIEPTSGFVYANLRQPTIVGSVPGVNDVKVNGVVGPITVPMSSTNGAIYAQQ